MQTAVANSAWPGTKDATEFGTPCAQYEYGTTKLLGVEDCLFLNVYTPQVRSQQTIVIRHIYLANTILIFIRLNI